MIRYERARLERVSHGSNNKNVRQWWSRVDESGIMAWADQRWQVVSGFESRQVMILKHKKSKVAISSEYNMRKRETITKNTRTPERR